MARLPSKSSVKNATVKHMKMLGTYREEFARLVDIYAGMVAQYYKLQEIYNATETDVEATKKSALVLELETLRKDILAYSDRLLLSPKTRNADTQQERKSALADVLLKFEK